MSVSAWFWLVVAITFFWVVPIALFFYRPKREVICQEEWGAIPYEHLKFGKGKEILGIALVGVLTSWLFWACVRTGLLVWK